MDLDQYADSPLFRAMKRKQQDHPMIEIGDRRFPLVALLCPVVNGARAESEWNRTLGIAPKDTMRYVPAENGLLFGVEQRPEDNGLWSLALYARACEISVDPNDTTAVIYLPQSVGLDGGDLVTTSDGIHTWSGAEPDWVVETIDRLSRKPFVQPKTPQVQLLPRIPVTREEAEAEED